MTCLAGLIVFAAVALILWDEYGRALWEAWQSLGQLDDSGDALA